jgi:hypothetical protein
VARNVYFSHGTKDEQYLIEDLIVESLQIYGQDFYYIPRKLVAKDEILGEDRLSEFKTAYPIEMYLENVDGFEGQGAFVQKFGLMMEQSATLTVARRRWDQLVGRFGQTQLPIRPCEGDLLYFPLTKGLFEIKFVKHQDPFYQLGKLYVYQLQVELFQYASEYIDTGVKEIDVFETLKSHDVDYIRNATGSIYSLEITNRGLGYTIAPTITLTGGEGADAFQPAVVEAEITATQLTNLKIVNAGTGYDTAPTVSIGTSWSSGTYMPTNSNIAHGTNLYRVTTGGNLGTTAPSHNVGSQANGTATLLWIGIRATAVATIYPNPTLPQSYGDNFAFQAEATDLLFNTNNPFGDVVELPGINKNKNTGAVTYDLTFDSTHYQFSSTSTSTKMDNLSGQPT